MVDSYPWEALHNPGEMQSVFQSPHLFYSNNYLSHMLYVILYNKELHGGGVVCRLFGTPQCLWVRLLQQSKRMVEKTQEEKTSVVQCLLGDMELFKLQML